MAVSCRQRFLLLLVWSLSCIVVESVDWDPSIRIPRGGGHRSWGRSSQTQQQQFNSINNKNPSKQEDLKSPLAPMHQVKEDATGYTYTFDLPSDLPMDDLSCEVRDSVMYLHGKRQLKKGEKTNKMDGFLEMDFSTSVPLQDDADVSCITVKRSSKGKLTVLAPKIGGTKTFKVEQQDD